LGRIRSSRFSNRRSDVKRVKASCSGPVRIRLTAIRYVTDTWNCVMSEPGTTNGRLRIPISRIPTMERIHGPELMMPA